MARETTSRIPLADVADLARLVQGVDAILNQRDVAEETFAFVSDAAVELLGYPLERWRTEPGFWLDTVVHPEERARVAALLDAALESSGAVLEYRAVRADGRTVWLRDHVQVDRSGGGRLVRGVMLDITDIRSAERTAERSYRSLELLKEVAEEANEAETGEAALAAVLGRVARFLEVEIAHAFVRPHDSKRLVPLTSWHEAPGVTVDELRVATAPMSFAEGMVGRVATTGEPLWIEDVAHSDMFIRRDAARAAGIHTAIATPVLAGETTAAVLEFFSTKRIPPDDDILEVLAAVGTSLGRAFEWEWNVAAIRERERKLREAQRLARLGGWTLDPARGTIVLSPELAEVAGLDREELTLAELLEHAVPEDRAMLRARLEASVREDFEVEPRLRRSDGRTLALHVRGRVRADPATGRTTVEGTAQDVTAHREAESTARELEIERRARQRAEAVQAKLVRTAAALARSNRQLDEFAYIASHDLKAPLRGIANLVRYLEEDIEADLDDETRNLMALLQTRVRWMQELIDGILTYSRAGRDDVTPEEIETADLLERILQMLPDAHHVTVDVAPEAERLVAPVAPLRQVLLNLVSNAVRHADPEDPQVHVTARIEGEDVHFAVRDNGPGIAPEFHDRIWVIFQTLQARDAGGGSGIGLAIVRKLVEQHGGRARVESEPGHGATFHFTWPRVAENREES